MRPVKAIEMTTARTRTEIVDWRRRQLLRGGVRLPLATEVATDPRYDLHALLVLIDRGCDPELAVRILAPLEDAEQC